MKANYVWLTGAMLAYDEFFGPKEGLPLPFLLRHGFCVAKGIGLAVTISETVSCLTRGNSRFYLTAVDAGGVPLDLSSTIFLPTMANGLVVSGTVLRTLRKICSLDDGCVVPIEPDCISAHAWNYSLHNRETVAKLYEQLHNDLDWDEMPGDDEILRQLCERFPANVSFPDMYLILGPYFRPADRIKKLQQENTIVMSVNKGVRVVTKDGEIPLSPDYFSSRPLVRYEGFLLPSEVASLFDTDENYRNWPILTCKKKVTIEFK